jgi:hypothetical protein
MKARTSVTTFPESGLILAGFGSSGCIRAAPSSDAAITAAIQTPLGGNGGRLRSGGGGGGDP